MLQKLCYINITVTNIDVAVQFVSLDSSDITRKIEVKKRGILSFVN